MASVVIPGPARPARVARLVVAVATGVALLLGGVTLVARRHSGPAAPVAGSTDLASARRAVATAARSNDPADYDTAQRAVQALRASSPGPESDLVAAVLALSLHDFAGAHDLGAAALAARPHQPDALAVLVDASVELGRYDEAEQHLDELLTRRPDAAAFARLSYLRELHGDLPGALDAMQRAVDDAGDPPDRATYLGFLGDLRLQQGDLEAAAAAYGEVHSLDPTRVSGELGRARVLAAKGDLTGAAALLEPVADRSPQPAVASVLATLHRLAGDAAGAERATALVDAHLRLLEAAGVAVDLDAAQLATELGTDPAHAVELAQGAYRIRHTVLTADALGWALTRAGRPAEAAPYVTEALHLGTVAPGPHLHAAATALALGQTDDARRELTAALAGTPYLDPSLRPLATRLAGQLGVALPSPWR